MSCRLGRERLSHLAKFDVKGVEIADWSFSIFPKWHLKSRVSLNRQE